MDNLEEKLQNNQDLFEIYSRIKGKTTHIWKQPLLHDFTEHGVRHSQKIIIILYRILNYWEKSDLNDVEILILLASAWLHGIGMQNMKDAEGKADILREAHSDYSYKIILKDGRVNEEIFLRQLECGFRDEHGKTEDYNLQNCVALVCKGHSGKYFQEVVEQFKDVPHSVLDQPVDGAFLTALLMVANELDLESRGNMDPSKHYGPVSRLHQKKHQRITKVDYDFDPKLQQMTVSLRFQFREEEDHFRNRLKQWVFDKLAGQFSRAMPIFQNKMDYCFSPLILQASDLAVLPAAQHPPKFSRDELSFLERETAEMDLYGRKREKKRLRELLDPNRPGGIFYYYNVDPYDRDFLFGWFEKAAHAHPGVSFQSLSIDTESAFTFSRKFLTQKTASCCNDVKSSHKSVLMVEDFGLLHPKLQNDYLKALPESTVLKHSKAVLLLLSSAGKSVLEKSLSHAWPVKMQPFTKETIKEILEYQKIPPGHDPRKMARKLYDITSGRPEKVYEFVELLRQ